MRRIFWDSMMLIYFLENHPQFGDRVRTVFVESVERGDQLMTSWLNVAELLAGTHRPEAKEKSEALHNALKNLPIHKLAFDERCSEHFGQLRARKVGIADSIHLSCAAAADVDLFLTNDKALYKLHVPGIKFIAGLDSGLI